MQLLHITFHCTAAQQMRLIGNQLSKLCCVMVQYVMEVPYYVYLYMCVYITKSLHSRPLAKNQPADCAHSLYSILVTSMERFDSSVSDLIWHHKLSVDLLPSFFSTTPPHQRFQIRWSPIKWCQIASFTLWLYYAPLFNISRERIMCCHFASWLHVGDFPSFDISDPKCMSSCITDHKYAYKLE